MKQTNCCRGSRNLAEERRNFPFRGTLRAVDRGSMCFHLSFPLFLPRPSSGIELKRNRGFVPRYRGPAATSMTDEISLFVRAEEGKRVSSSGKACHIGQVKRGRGRGRERKREIETVACVERRASPDRRKIGNYKFLCFPRPSPPCPFPQPVYLSLLIRLSLSASLPREPVLPARFRSL